MVTQSTMIRVRETQQKAYHDAHYAVNGERLKAFARRYHNANRTPERKRRAWLRGLKSRFGINEAEYMLLFDEQRGRCAICGGTENRRLAVDHNHKTGKVRGLLCGACNTKLGWFEIQANNIVNYLGE